MIYDRREAAQAARWCVLAVVIIGGFLLAIWGVAHARDDGRYANSTLKSWFDSLRSPSGVPCCDVADGLRLDDPDWDTQGGHYRVRIDGQWIAVPDYAVIRAVNRAGNAIVWPYKVEGETIIRCFIAGAMG